MHHGIAEKGTNTREVLEAQLNAALDHLPDDVCNEIRQGHHPASAEITFCSVIAHALGMSNIQVLVMARRAKTGDCLNDAAALRLVSGNALAQSVGLFVVGELLGPMLANLFQQDDSFGDLAAQAMDARFQ